MSPSKRLKLMIFIEIPSLILVITVGILGWWTHLQTMLGRKQDATVWWALASVASAAGVRYLTSRFWEWKQAWKDARESKEQPNRHLLRAATEGDLPALQHWMTQEDPALKDWSGRTPLMRAIANGHAQCAQLLLEKGDPWARNGAESALVLALSATEQREACVQVMAEAWAQAQAQDRRRVQTSTEGAVGGLPPASASSGWAAQQEDPSEWEREKAAASAREKQAQQALREAVLQENARCWHILIEAGLRPQPDAEGNTLLMVAVCEGKISMIASILPYVCPTALDKHWKSAFAQACERGLWACADALGEFATPGEQALASKWAANNELSRSQALWEAVREREALSQTLTKTPTVRREESVNPSIDSGSKLFRVPVEGPCDSTPNQGGSSNDAAFGSQGATGARAKRL